MFAYREVPEQTLGFSPFELVYGWPLKGLMSLIKDQWISHDDDKNVISYVLEMRNMMVDCMKIAHKTLYKAQSDMKTWYDQNAKERSFEIGDKVLILLPTCARSLEAQ
jgi:hypothetical protein